MNPEVPTSASDLTYAEQIRETLLLTQWPRIAVGLHRHPAERWAPDGDLRPRFGIEVNHADERRVLDRLSDLCVPAEVVARSQMGSKEGYAVIGTLLPLSGGLDARSWLERHGFEVTYA